MNFDYSYYILKLGEDDKHEEKAEDNAFHHGKEDMASVHILSGAAVANVNYLKMMINSIVAIVVF